MKLKLIGKTAIVFGMAFLLFTGCSKDNSKATEANSNLEKHIDSLEVAMENNGEWVQENWAELEAEFNELRTEVEDENLLKKVDAKWDSLTSNVKSWVNENIVEPQSTTPRLMSAYSVLGIEAENDVITSVDKQNIDDKYRIFVDSVEAHKKEYNLYDWNRIEMVWDALNVKKEELEPLETTKELEIAKQRTRYAGIKAIRKTDDKIEEVLKNK